MNAVADIRGRWGQGAPRGDPYKLGFNTGLVNALYSIEQAAEDAGIEPADIGLEDGWAVPFD